MRETVGVALFLVFLLLISVCVLLALPWGLALTVLGVVQRRRARAVRGLAWVCGALGVGGYVLGAMLVLVSQGEADHGTDSSPAPACRQANFGMTVTTHEAGYFPLRFDCRLADGSTRSAGVVSWWVTPVVVVLVAAGGWLALDERRHAPERLWPIAGQ